MTSRVPSVAGALALAVSALAIGSASPAHAEVTLDCAGGPVAITSSTESYVLTGACSTVRISASNVDVTLPGASRVEITGANVTVVSAGSLDVVTVREANNTVRAPRGGAATIKGANNTLRYDKLERLVIRGANNRATVRQGKTKVSVSGANNVVRVNRPR
ncbi:DUF3060 domain-containing protein [Nocardioides anomalus]|uniref:DUF3060 domain-containing protein n=1 Tax=Nocardioides anomalus TaxID=2712223 RepID=A0A6G6WDU7_9ACTN|nr:DUF3060 domain-containing protein [Nocardioides anomalus]QIG43404.1 DUF3060 domain-containing protein [Nocardioides anomalus]